MFNCLGCKNRMTDVCKVCVGWNKYESKGISNSTDTDISKETSMLAKYALNDVFGVRNAYERYSMTIKKVIFNNPATIVLWTDGAKTVVKCGEGETFDPEKGLAMAIAKKALGNKGNYYKVFKKWLPDVEEGTVTTDFQKSLAKLSAVLGIKSLSRVKCGECIYHDPDRHTCSHVPGALERFPEESCIHGVRKGENS